MPVCTTAGNGEIGQIFYWGTGGLARKSINYGRTISIDGRDVDPLSDDAYDYPRYT
jgi:hypothetical protein